MDADGKHSDLPKTAAPASLWRGPDVNGMLCAIVVGSRVVSMGPSSGHQGRSLQAERRPRDQFPRSLGGIRIPGGLPNLCVPVSIALIPILCTCYGFRSGISQIGMGDTPAPPEDRIAIASQVIQKMRKAIEASEAEIMAAIGAQAQTAYLSTTSHHSML